MGDVGAVGRGRVGRVGGIRNIKNTNYKKLIQECVCQIGKQAHLRITNYPNSVLKSLKLNRKSTSYRASYEVISHSESIKSE